MKGGKSLNALFLLTTTASDLESKARMLGFDTQFLVQTAIHAATAIALFVILGKLIFKPVSKILVKRKEDIATEYQKIKNQSEEGKALIEDYQAKLANVKKEAGEIIAEARKAALVQETNILNEARLESDRIINRAQLEIERERESVKEEIKKEIVEVATLMASKFVVATMDEKTKSQLFDQALVEIGEETWQN